MARSNENSPRNWRLSSLAKYSHFCLARCNADCLHNLVSLIIPYRLDDVKTGWGVLSANHKLATASSGVSAK